jgi:hypothetical protein
MTGVPRTPAAVAMAIAGLEAKTELLFVRALEARKSNARQLQYAMGREKEVLVI